MAYLELREDNKDTVLASLVGDIQKGQSVIIVGDCCTKALTDYLTKDITQVLHFNVKEERIKRKIGDSIDDNLAIYVSMCEKATQDSLLLVEHLEELESLSVLESIVINKDCRLLGTVKSLDGLVGMDIDNELITLVVLACNHTSKDNR